MPYSWPRKARNSFTLPSSIETDVLKLDEKGNLRKPIFNFVRYMYKER